MLPRRHFDFLKEHGWTRAIEMLESGDPAAVNLVLRQAREMNLPGLVEMLTHVWYWSRAGRNTIVAGKVLQDVFSKMSCDAVPPEKVWFPAGSVYVQLPDCDWKIWGGDTGWHKVSGFYAIYDQLLEKHEQPRGVKLFDRKDWNDHVHIMLWADDKPGMYGDALLWTSFSLADEYLGDGYEKMLETSLDEIAVARLHVFEADKDRVKPDELRRETKRAAIGVMRVLLNMLAYMNTNPRDVLVESNREILQKRAADLKAQYASTKNEGKGKKIRRRLETEMARKIAVETTTWIGPTLIQEIEQEREKHAGSKMRWHPVRPYWNTFHTRQGLVRKLVFTPHGRGDRAMGVVASRVYRFVEDTPS